MDKQAKLDDLIALPIRSYGKPVPEYTLYLTPAQVARLIDLILRTENGTFLVLGALARLEFETE